MLVPDWKRLLRVDNFLVPRRWHVLIRCLQEFQHLLRFVNLSTLLPKCFLYLPLRNNWVKRRRDILVELNILAFKFIWYQVPFCRYHHRCGFGEAFELAERVALKHHSYIWQLVLGGILYWRRFCFGRCRRISLWRLDSTLSLCYLRRHFKRLLICLIFD